MLELNMKKKQNWKQKIVCVDTVSLISGRAFQRRKPRDGFRRSYAADESICSATYEISYRSKTRQKKKISLVAIESGSGGSCFWRTLSNWSLSERTITPGSFVGWWILLPK